MPWGWRFVRSSKRWEKTCLACIRGVAIACCAWCYVGVVTLARALVADSGIDLVRCDRGEKPLQEGESVGAAFVLGQPRTDALYVTSSRAGRVVCVSLLRTTRRGGVCLR
jgi:hypothetical protein